MSICEVCNDKNTVVALIPGGRLGTTQPCPACQTGLPIYAGHTPALLLHFRKVGA